MPSAQPGKTHRLTGKGPGLPHQDAEGQVFGQVWNQTNPVL